jgi:hypothetical protein
MWTLSWITMEGFRTLVFGLIYTSLKSCMYLLPKSYMMILARSDHPLYALTTRGRLVPVVASSPTTYGRVLNLCSGQRWYVGL